MPQAPALIVAHGAPSCPPSQEFALEDLAARVAANPQQREFYGVAGRHYHVEHFMLDRRPGAPPGGTPAVAVAEVSRYLLVRPVRDGMIQFLIGLSLFIALVMALLGWLFGWDRGRLARRLGR